MTKEKLKQEIEQLLKEKNLDEQKKMLYFKSLLTNPKPHRLNKKAYSYFGIIWSLLNQLGIEKKCTICNIGAKIIIHHIDGNPENNSLENLAPLCQKHHMIVHGVIERGRLKVKELNNNWKGGKHKKICPFCNKKFESHHPLALYCSKQCGNTSRRSKTKLTCRTCKKEFKVVSSQIERRKFCGFDCAYGNRKGDKRRKKWT